MASGKGQDVAEFNTPPALLWDSFYAVVWLDLCILDFFYLSLN